MRQLIGCDGRRGIGDLHHHPGLDLLERSPCSVGGGEVLIGPAHGGGGGGGGQTCRCLPVDRRDPLAAI